MMDDNYTALSIPSDHSLVDTVHNRKPQVKTCHSCSTQDNEGFWNDDKSAMGSCQ